MSFMAMLRERDVANGIQSRQCCGAGSSGARCPQTAQPDQLLCGFCTEHKVAAQIWATTLLVPGEPANHIFYGACTVLAVDPQREFWRRIQIKTRYNLVTWVSQESFVTPEPLRVPS